MKTRAIIHAVDQQQKRAEVVEEVSRRSAVALRALLPANPSTISSVVLQNQGCASTATHQEKRLLPATTGLEARDWSNIPKRGNSRAKKKKRKKPGAGAWRVSLVSPTTRLSSTQPSFPKPTSTQMVSTKAEAEALSVEELKTELTSRGLPTEGLKVGAFSLALVPLFSASLPHIPRAQNIRLVWSQRAAPPLPWFHRHTCVFLSASPLENGAV